MASMKLPELESGLTEASRHLLQLAQRACADGALVWPFACIQVGSNFALTNVEQVINDESDIALNTYRIALRQVKADRVALMTEVYVCPNADGETPGDIQEAVDGLIIVDQTDTAAIYHKFAIKGSLPGPRELVHLESYTRPTERLGQLLQPPSLDRVPGDIAHHIEAAADALARHIHRALDKRGIVCAPVGHRLH